MSFRTREGSVPVVTRATPSQLEVNNIYGTKSVNVKTCKCCGTTKPIDDFYFESKSKTRTFEQVRSHCITCWDKYKGKIPRSYDPTTTLEIFEDDIKNIKQTKFQAKVRKKVKSYPPTNNLESYIMENKNARALPMGRKVSSKDRS